MADACISFLIECLKSYNFGSNFIKWIKIFYNNIQSYVGNNGFYSGFFNLTRGIRQGCPISALLFILVVETLAIKIRQEKSLRGIKINNVEIKLCQLADDTTLFLKDNRSVGLAFTILKQFERTSGLKVNLEKSTVIPIGLNKFNKIILPKECKKVPVVSKEFKTLGIWFSENTEEMIKLNFDSKIVSLEKLLHSWSLRKLSLKALSLIQHLLSVLHCPKEALEKIDKLIFDFLWDGKPPKIKREIVVSNFSAGGIRMPDIFIVHKKAKISWSKRLAIDFNTNATWAKLMWAMLNFDKNDLNHKVPHSYIKTCVTPFHKQLMECRLLFKSQPPQNVEEIHNEYIFANKFVCSNNKPLKHIDFRGVHGWLQQIATVRKW